MLPLVGLLRQGLITLRRVEATRKGLAESSKATLWESERQILSLPGKEGCVMLLYYALVN